MTSRERAEIITSVCNMTLRSGNYDDRDEESLRRLIVDAIDTAVKEEREACAKLADKESESVAYMAKDCGCHSYFDSLAQKIRDRI